jgi:hypothetical protein
MSKNYREEYLSIVMNSDWAYFDSGSLPLCKMKLKPWSSWPLNPLAGSIGNLSILSEKINKASITVSEKT